jgi:hypothetical protein
MALSWVVRGLNNVGAGLFASPKPLRTAVGPNQPPTHWVNGREVTTPLHLVPGLRVNGVIPNHVTCMLH